MSNIVALTPQGSVRDYEPKQLALIKRTVAADTNDDEFNLFMEAARRIGLDPFRKQIYAIVYNKTKKDKRKMAIITGIDGFRAVAERSQTYRPDEDEPKIAYDDELKDDTNPLGILKATVTVFKFGPDKEWHRVTGVAYWDEFAPIKEGGDWKDTGAKWPDGNAKQTFVSNGKNTLATGNWVKMPRVMIGKCAESQALRKGWPENLSGVYAHEEVERQMIDITATEAIEQHQAEERELLINNKDCIAIIWMPGQPLDYVPEGVFVDRCMEYLNRTERLDIVAEWKETNKESLNRFWAKSPNDALELKKAIDAKLNTG